MEFQKPQKGLQHEIILNEILYDSKDLLQLENPDQPCNYPF